MTIGVREPRPLLQAVVVRDGSRGRLTAVVRAARKSRSDKTYRPVVYGTRGGGTRARTAVDNVRATERADVRT